MALPRVRVSLWNPEGLKPIFLQGIGNSAPDRNGCSTGMSVQFSINGSLVFPSSQETSALCQRHLLHPVPTPWHWGLFTQNCPQLPWVKTVLNKLTTYNPPLYQPKIITSLMKYYPCPEQLKILASSVVEATFGPHSAPAYLQQTPYRGTKNLPFLLMTSTSYHCVSSRTSYKKSVKLNLCWQSCE